MQLEILPEHISLYRRLNYLVKIIYKFLADFINKVCQRIGQTLKFSDQKKYVFGVICKITFSLLLKCYIFLNLLEPSKFTPTIWSCSFSKQWLLAGEFSEFEYSRETRRFWRV
jgi:hypothetical protein